VAVTGQPPQQWLHAERIRVAQELLETSDATIDVIAARSGMGTATTLRRHFRAAVGVTPTAYRSTFGGAALRQSGRPAIQV
jgi:transcriptional regulator GlxA family with amidase domain